jgi:adenylate cyclase
MSPVDTAKIHRGLQRVARQQKLFKLLTLGLFLRKRCVKKESRDMDTDIFSQETKVLADFKKIKDDGTFSQSDFDSLVDQYSKLLRTTKKIIKLSDKNEQRLNQLKTEAQETNEQLEGMSAQLSKFLSPQLYNSIFSGSRHGTRVSRRKKLTVFFSDLCGFTNYVESMESEDVTDLLNLYLETMTNIALDHGATIDKYIGDGIMLFFGDPETRGVKEDAIQCVNMAIEMLSALDNLADEWAKYGLRDQLQMRIGIDTGFATVGNFGCESRLDYTAIGAAVNRASRLETAADNGSIYISEDTYNLVKDSIEADALPPIHLKGIGEFQARKVIASRSTKSVSMALGERNVSFVLDNLSTAELESTKQSLAKALSDIGAFQDERYQE